MVPPDLEVGRVVPRSDLQRSRSELRVDAIVRDDRHAPLDDRHEHFPADQVPVALVLRVHRDRDVGEHRRRTHRRDGHRAPALHEGVARVGQRVVDLEVLDLEVRDRRLAVGAPVDDPVRAVHPAALVQVHEEAHHGADVSVVHGEALALVVERAAEPPELAHDHAAVLAQPLPDALDERLASDLLPRRALFAQLLLHHRLRRDAGVVVTGLPERVEAAHPVQADQHVLERPVQRVPHVQRTRDVRRRHGDHVRRGRIVGVRAVEALLLPRQLPAFLDALRLVERLQFHQAPILATVKRMTSRSDY